MTADPEQLVAWLGTAVITSEDLVRAFVAGAHHGFMSAKLTYYRDFEGNYHPEVEWPWDASVSDTKLAAEAAAYLERRNRK